MSEAAQKLSELQPIIVERVALKDGRALMAHKPLTFYPYMSPCGKYYHLRYEELDLNLFDDNYDGLEILVRDDIAWLWQHVVENKATALSKGSENLREKFHEYFVVQE